MPRSSSAGAPELRGAVCWAASGTGPRLLHHVRRDDLAGLDLSLDRVQALDHLGRHDAARAGEVDAALLEAEQAVMPAVELALLEVADRLEHGLVDLLDGRGQDERAERVLVVVDADAPHVVLPGRVERAEAAAAGDLEHDVRAGRDLRRGEALALVLGDEVVRVAVE